MKHGHLADLEVTQIKPNGSNVRAKLTDIDKLAASIEQLGVIQPLIVVGNGTGKTYTIVAGHRRHAAAQKAGLDRVPCLVADDMVEAEQLLAMMAENDQRVDVAGVDAAKAIRQLQMLAVPDERIAQVTGHSVEAIAQAENVIGNKDVLDDAKANTHGEPTFEQLAALAEFHNDGDDESTYQWLLDALWEEPEKFDHTLSLARNERADREKHDALKIELESQGVKLLTSIPSTYFGTSNRPVQLSQLKSKPDGKGTITQTAHKNCPGQCAYLPEHATNRKDLIWACADPKLYGHFDIDHRPTAAPGKQATTTAGEPLVERNHKQVTEAEAKRADAATEARRATVACNKAMEAAIPVRQKFVAELLAKKTPPKQMVKFIMDSLLSTPHLLDADVDEDLAKRLAGVKIKQGVTGAWGTIQVDLPGTDPLRLYLLCKLLVIANEQHMNRESWRNGSRARTIYLAWLNANGYTESTVEKVMVEHNGKGYGALTSAPYKKLQAKVVDEVKKAAGR